MTHSPGKYDAECTLVRERTNAEGVIVMVVGGTDGSGFSVQTSNPDFLVRLPALIRTMADHIEADVRQHRVNQRRRLK